MLKSLVVSVVIWLLVGVKGTVCLVNFVVVGQLFCCCCSLLLLPLMFSQFKVGHLLTVRNEVALHSLPYFPLVSPHNTLTEVNNVK